MNPGHPGINRAAHALIEARSKTRRSGGDCHPASPGGPSKHSSCCAANPLNGMRNGRACPYISWRATHLAHGFVQHRADPATAKVNGLLIGKRGSAPGAARGTAGYRVSLAQNVNVQGRTQSE